MTKLIDTLRSIAQRFGRRATGFEPLKTRFWLCCTLPPGIGREFIEKQVPVRATLKLLKNGARN